MTLDNVLRERRIELAFENKGYWDLIRRRDFHSEFDNRRKMALVPMIDLRGEKPQYIFVRKFVPGANSCTFQTHHYYRHIPGTSTNGLIRIQNTNLTIATMKRNIKNMAFALLTLFAVTSCDLLEIDNYDGPNATIEGKILTLKLANWLNRILLTGHKSNLSNMGLRILKRNTW